MTSKVNGSFPLSASSASFIRWMVGSIALINLFVFGVVAFTLYQSLAEIEERAELTAQNLSQLMAQDIAGDVDKIDLVLHSAVDEIERQFAAGGIDGKVLNAYLARQQERLPVAFSLRVSDAHGIVRYGLGVDPEARVMNVDREYFIRQRDKPTLGLVIARPVITRIDREWVIPFSRAIRLPDGSFGGIVYATLTLQHMARTFAAIDVGRRGSVSLRDAELRVLAVHPVPENVGNVIGEKLAIPELQEMIQAGRDAGTYVTAHTVDGVERKFAARKVPNHPLYVVVGRATEEYMAHWKNHALQTSLLAALFCLTTLISSWLIYRNWKRQVAATMELAREEEKFHTVADHTYDWEYWEGPAREILFMSPSCERVTGYAPSEFLVDPDLLNRIIHPDDLQLMAAHRHDAAHKDEARLDFRILRRNGEIRWIAHGCRAVFGLDGQFRGRRVSNRDITERKEAEAAVHQINAELEQRVAQRTAQLEVAKTELEEFSYSISHDLRTPLRAIAGFAQILVEEHAGSLDHEGRRLLDVVRSNSLRMGQLIDELLEFLQLGRRRMEFGQVDTVQLVQEVFDELRASVPERKLRLVLRNPPPLWGDRSMIRQLLKNLLSNAIKFTQPRLQAVIEVGGSGDAGEGRYYVKDNGVGFDMKYVDKLFQVFERVHPVGQFEGCGTGLAMAKRIVGRHGGRVWAEGQVDAGSCFHFTLPAQERRHDTDN